MPICHLVQNDATNNAKWLHNVMGIAKWLRKKVVLNVIFAISLVVLIHPGRFAVLFYDVQLDPTSFASEICSRSDSDKCKTALVVPFRDRSQQLKEFLHNIRPFLRAQNVSYFIIVVDQEDRKPFNRGKLLNVGFIEANLMRDDLECFIFHDIDLLPIDTRNWYTCGKRPRHLTANVDYFRYNLPYVDLMGGAIAIDRQQFIKVNGFSNEFFGWGGEDDDFAQNRLKRHNIVPTRFNTKISRYKSISDVKAKKTVDKMSNDKHKTSFINDVDDGLSNIEYSVVSSITKTFYTHLKVNL